jgi:hypothetical protein
VRGVFFEKMFPGGGAQLAIYPAKIHIKYTRQQKYLKFKYTELAPWSSVLLEETGVSQILKKFPALYENLRSITVFTTACQQSFTCAR